MGSRVSISKKAARAVLDLAEMGTKLHNLGNGAGTELLRGLNELRDALRPKVSKPSRLASRKTKKARRESRRDETARIRAEVFKRADGRCELLCGRLATDLHHVLGRVRVEQHMCNTLAACRECHRAITDNKPSAEYWLAAQAQVLEALAHRDPQYAETARKLRDRIEAKGLVGAAWAMAAHQVRP